ncbi:MAG: molybdopterin-synthase adenylyltransferase MoeB [Cytophagales bacterium]|nr:molybdopterin-synthase adenylyltransferase MoeB [Cytophagales bacterium]
MELSLEELQRYSRHLNLPNFGLAAQQMLKKAKVLVVGTGGLGAPMLQYLTAAGVGTIGVVDFDEVDASNLQRQVLFTTEDIGRSKVAVTIERLSLQNPNTTFIPFETKLDSSNALEIIKDFDVVADGTDNFQTRYLVNDACILSGKVNVYASIFQFEGQVSVFNYQFEDGTSGPNYRDLFPSPPPPGMVPSCAEGGVLGVLPGIVGSLQASEVLKVITGMGDPLVGRLFLFDALHFTTRVLKVQKDDANPLTGIAPSITELIDYDAFCGLKGLDDLGQITVTELQGKAEASYTLIDVRETYEFDAGNIGGIHIPLSQLEKHLEQIPRNGDVVIHCKSGGRSQKAVDLLKDKYGYSNLLNLQGGVTAWQKEIDPDLVVV